LGREVAELDYAASSVGEFSPAAWLFGILFDGLVFLAIEEEASRPQALGAGAGDAGFASVNFDLRGGHELVGDREQEGVVEHVVVPDNMLIAAALGRKLAFGIRSVTPRALSLAEYAEVRLSTLRVCIQQLRSSLFRTLQCRSSLGFGDVYSGRVGCYRHPQVPVRGTKARMIHQWRRQK
jgi:hypothetical protein